MLQYMKPTKQHIADKALRLFNEKGFVNVRLQHIADAAFVSIGHLAYHFRNKDAILEFHYGQISREVGELLAEHRVLPLFEDIDRMLLQWFEHQLRYRFFYLDTIEIIRAYPQLASAYREHLRWQQMQLSVMLGFNVSRGSMDLAGIEPERLASLMQVLISNWLHNNYTKYGQSFSAADFTKDVWLLLRPWCTSTGLQELARLG
jgi:AcrR family transcriptional regulator